MPSGVYRRSRNNRETFGPLYKLWFTIKSRCSNPNTANYKYYGARGIKVCDEWDMDFQAFKKWCLDTGWQTGLSIDRLDSNRNYSPSNCRWATPKQQARNRRNNVVVEYNGMKKCLAEWAEYFGIRDCVVLTRYRRGIPLDRVFSTKKLINQYS